MRGGRLAFVGALLLACSGSRAPAPPNAEPATVVGESEGEVGSATTPSELARSDASASGGEAPPPAAGEAPPPGVEEAPPPAVGEGGADPTAAVEPVVADAADPLAGFVDATPRCPAEAEACFGIHLHVVVDEGAPVRDVAWVSDQVARAEERFGAAIGVGFEIIAVDALPAEQRAIVSRLDRDKLGRPHFSRGVVHVFVVGSLADVDGPGEIRGVHWRDRAATERRWVILSSIAGSLTLTHELGHFFSLPHSRYPVSLMNKGESPIPWSERAFHPREAQRMKRARTQMVASGALRARPRPKDGEPG